ncbi:MAG: hypothetical protein SH817_16650 [Leptospira sp.]|nr:hypothetical protein [Leptospira sp.]
MLFKTENTYLIELVEKLVFRLIIIIAVVLFFAGKSNFPSFASIEPGESEVPELTESKPTPKEESKSDFFTIIPIHYSYCSFLISRSSAVNRSSVSFETFSSLTNRGPPHRT